LHVFIKAFNRTFYLARLLSSLRQHAIGVSRITVLDDGTPRRFLEKIERDYPEVRIVQAPHGELKTQLMQQGRYAEQLSSAEQAALGLMNAAEFWVSEVERWPDKLIAVLEEDVWLIRALDLPAVTAVLSDHYAVMYRFFWNCTPQLVPPAETLRIVPAGRSSVHFYWPKVKSPLDRGKVFMPGMAIYRRDYWLHAFRAPDYCFQMSSQFERATQYVKARRNHVTFAHSGEELVRHGYSSTSRRTNFVASARFDPMPLNLALNSAWLDGNLDETRDLPEDFDEETVVQAVKGRLAQHDVDAWRRWKRSFLDYYRSMGARL